MRSVLNVTTHTTYKSVIEASKATGISKDRLYYCLKHNKKWIDGEQWMYALTINGITGEVVPDERDFDTDDR